MDEYRWPETDDELKALLHDLLVLPRDSAAQRNALQEVLDLPSLKPDTCWRMIELAAAMELTPYQAALIAAGPLEDLLGHHGAAFIDRVESAVRRDPGMRMIAGGVWRGSMPRPIWDRFIAMRERLGVKPI